MKFELDNDADRSGTSLQGYFTASYADLSRLFGEAADSDGYKVSSEWTFVSEDGEVFALYDYKETSLYDRDNPSVEEFRALKTYDWHIGASHNSNIKAFKAWLKEQIGSLPEPHASVKRTFEDIDRAEKSIKAALERIPARRARLNEVLKAYPDVQIQPFANIGDPHDTMHIFVSPSVKGEMDDCLPDYGFERTEEYPGRKFYAEIACYKNTDVGRIFAVPGRIYINDPAKVLDELADHGISFPAEKAEQLRKTLVSASEEDD